ncbi:MAG TPA: YihY/virulence factor BrkB family protein [Phycisphaerae bacterium]|jgi:membrane protein
MSARRFWDMIAATVRDFRQDNALRLAAALSYYTALALAPLLLVVLAIARLIWSRQAASQRLLDQFQTLFGHAGAEVVRSILASAAKPHQGITATIIGLLTLLAGATGLFLQLQAALNVIWEVQPRSEGVRGVIKKRLLSLAMVLGVGFLLLASLVFSAALAALSTYLKDQLPGSLRQWNVVNVAVSLLIVTLLFALIFKYLPDVQVRWRDVWIGALATGVLFTIGKFVIGWYLGRGTVGSAYGAAASFVVLLVWIYYSSVILFFGAEFTQAHARFSGAPLIPQEHARVIADTDHATKRAHPAIS